MLLWFLLLLSSWPLLTLTIAVQCPPASTQLVRDASGISQKELSYFTARKQNADRKLHEWLRKVTTRPVFPDSASKPPPWGDFELEWTTLPSVALASSGGGYRALLAGAGVVKGLDSTEKQDKGHGGLGGLYQALTYHAGLSGGAWLVASMASNDWPNITTLKDGLWKSRFPQGVFVPGTNLAQEMQHDALIREDVQQKENAGYDTTMTDPWGRLLSYQLFEGGITQSNNTLSNLAGKSKFKDHAVPYPIMTAILASSEHPCDISPSNTQIEMHPFEWGSWDEGVHAFTDPAYLGTVLKYGKPVNLAPLGKPECMAGFDDLGYIMGTSSNIFTFACSHNMSLSEISPLGAVVLEEMMPGSRAPNVHDLFASYINPFRMRYASKEVTHEAELLLTDGGLSDHNCPIWPFIQPARAKTVDVLIVNDNSADVNHFPNGTAIYNTFLRARKVGLTRMPTIPPPEKFVTKGFNARGVFFGCDEPDTLTIIYLPNAEFSHPSNQDTLKVQYSAEEIDGMIENGVKTARQGTIMPKGWDVCVACAIMKKSNARLSDICLECFNKYCFRYGEHKMFSR
ncbi:FabD/lysophospholipase-like protein [Microthyrium microscopicum]|uniref:Lysophospholipase n=1 Tax=Microthyrium microscopicum TaxID=703497 RepID=A0A6A6TX49_9PEZI|nr:FabD/lysophospholipase-like protein [Microthyrium microscopicum]